MSVPVIYYGNVLLSGSVSGDQATGANPVLPLWDGSVNTSYEFMASGAGSRTGTVGALSTSRQTYDAVIAPKWDVEAGITATVVLQDTPAGGSAQALLTSDPVLASETEFWLRELSPTSGNFYTGIQFGGAAGQPAAQTAAELMLATKYTLPRSPEVAVTRTFVRQFTRLPVPGGQPYTRRNGPMLRRTDMEFVVLSGTEVDSLRTFVKAVDGGQAFVFKDDLASTYWAELLDADVVELDEAGVSRVSLSFQEIKVENG